MSDNTLETRATPPDPPEGGSGVRDATRKRIGTYEIRRIIASGGMGTVYEAWQQTPRRAVALKVMKVGLSSHSARERFEREAQVLARLHHPGIVQVYDSGTHIDGEESTPFIAMEFVVGAQTLVQYAKEKALTPRQIVELLVQICEAVQHGNEKGIIHRDLKPSNLLVDSDGRVKVIDFGVARALDNDEAPLTLQTQVGQLVGTVHYMSPEQVGGDSRTLDARTDVYSLGVVLYELLSHRLPHLLEGKSLAEASRIVKEDAPTTLHDAAPRLDSSLETVVMKAIAKERGDRYASVHELGEDLSRWLRGEEILARRAGAFATGLGNARRWANRNRLAAAIAIILIANILAWVVTQQIAFRLPSFAPITARLEIGSDRGMVTNFERVRAIIVNKADGSRTAESDAKAANIEGVSNSDARSWRALHAALMKKLATSGAKAVAFDIHFPESDPRNDDAMLAGIDAVTRADIPLVLFRNAWPESTDGKIEAKHRILSDPRVVIGVGVAASPGDGTVLKNIVLANQRGQNDPWPGLALAAWVGKELGRDPIQYSYDFLGTTIEATSREPASSVIGSVIRKLSVPVTVIQEVPVGDSEHNTHVKDREALRSLPSPTSEAINRATISMGDALTMSESQLREVFGGRIVVVADAAGDTPIEFANGVKARGYAAHMAAIETLSRTRVAQVADTGECVVAVGLSALIGIAMAAIMRTLCASRLLWLCNGAGAGFAAAFGVGVVLAFCYICPMAIGVIVHPLAPGLAAACAAGLSGALVTSGDSV